MSTAYYLPQYTPPKPIDWDEFIAHHLRQARADYERYMTIPHNKRDATDYRNIAILRRSIYSHKRGHL